MGFMPNFSNVGGFKPSPEDLAMAEEAGVFSKKLLNIVDDIMDAINNKDKEALRSAMSELKRELEDAGVTEQYKLVALSSMVMALGINARGGL
jgi:hypothetical protein